MPVPDAANLRQYLQVDPSAVSDETLKAALAVEAAAQARVCRVDEANYPEDLAEALRRRVARNLAMRNFPTAVQADDMGSLRLGASDPEVRRLERPHRKVVLG